MADTNFIITSASFQTNRGAGFDIFNIPQNDHLVNGPRQTYRDTFNIIKESEPHLITLKSQNMNSETIADSIYDLDSLFYFQLRPQKEAFKNSSDGEQRTVNLIFQRRADANRLKTESSV